LDIAFASRAIRQLCEGEIEARRRLGARVASKLKRRLADLYAATRVTGFAVGRPHKLPGGRGDKMAIALDAGVKLVFCANHNVNPTTRSGTVSWRRVTRIKILSIENRYAKKKGFRP
jgi:proteic killer suppression protein